MYDFDKIIDVSGTSRMKYGNPPEGAPADIIPMWIADMDFQTYPGMIKAMIERAEHGIFGYTNLPQSYREAVAGWMERRHGWKMDLSWISVGPGIIPALKAIVEAFTEPGEGVLVQTPVYYMFMDIIQLMGRRVVTNPLLRCEDGSYKMDYEDLKKKAASKDVKMLILCNPHNPVCRIWTKEELYELGRICRENGVIVVSDEIHQDFLYEGKHYSPFPTAGENFSDFSVICTAPSKTFNCAGLKTCNTIIPNPELKKQFDAQAKRFGQTGINPMSITGVEAAYRDGDVWVDELVSYIRSNFSRLEEYCKTEIPGIRMTYPECLYMAWLDVSGLGMTGDDYYQRCLEEGVWLESGSVFGEGGDSFVRINLACPAETLEKALPRLRAAAQQRG